MQLIHNHTNPGAAPVEGDWVEFETDGGSRIKKAYHETVDVPAEEIAENAARHWRDQELKATDWIVPVTDHPQHAAYMAYRQALRDWPSTNDFPSTEPELGA